MSRSDKPAVRPIGLVQRRADFVDALAKGLEVLGAFERDAALSNGDLVRLTGLPKATVSRLTGTLLTLGYLQRDEGSRKYIIGSRVLGLGANLQRSMRLQRAARPLMQKVADTLDMGLVLGTREGSHILFLEIARAPRSLLKIESDIGSHVPMFTTAIGLACLVACPVRDRVKLLQELQQREPGEWAGIRERVERAHAERQKHRFITSLHSRGGTLSAVSVPLIAERGRVFAFAAVGRSPEVTAARLRKLAGPTLADMVDSIARDLGGSVATAALPARVRRPDDS